MEELFAGESRNIEYKREVPGNSAKYMKTVVAFASQAWAAKLFLA